MIEEKVFAVDRIQEEREIMGFPVKVILSIINNIILILPIFIKVFFVKELSSFATFA